jgi:hypothetical protein
MVRDMGAEVIPRRSKEAQMNKKAEDPVRLSVACRFDVKDRPAPVLVPDCTARNILELLYECFNLAIFYNGFR